MWTGSGLTRFAVLFLIELSTCRIEIAGITSEPDAAWMSQVSRNVTDASDGFLTGKRFLILPVGGQTRGSERIVFRERIGGLLK